jgi:DNA-binding response OmpR family regulator
LVSERHLERFAKVQLERQGYRTEVAASVDEARSWLTRARFGAVVVDPQVNRARAFLRALPEDEATQHLKVVELKLEREMRR